MYKRQVDQLRDNNVNAEIFLDSKKNLGKQLTFANKRELPVCLLYTSDAADDSLRVDLGGRRIIKIVFSTNNRNW